MPNVTYLGTTYPCAKALKGEDYIHLLDSDGVLIVAFDGVKDFSGFTIDTDWTVPTPEGECYIAVIGDDGVIRKGGHRCCDIPFTDTEEIDIDETPTKDSTNLVTSGGTYQALNALYPVGIVCQTTIIGGYPPIGTWMLYNSEVTRVTTSDSGVTSEFANIVYGEEPVYRAIGEVNIGRNRQNVTITGGVSSHVSYDSATGIATWSAYLTVPSTRVDVIIAHSSTLYTYGRTA